MNKLKTITLLLFILPIQLFSQKIIDIEADSLKLGYDGEISFYKKIFNASAHDSISKEKFRVINPGERYYRVHWLSGDYFHMGMKFDTTVVNEGPYKKVYQFDNKEIYQVDRVSKGMGVDEIEKLSPQQLIEKMNKYYYIASDNKTIVTTTIQNNYFFIHNQYHSYKTQKINKENIEFKDLDLNKIDESIYEYAIIRINKQYIMLLTEHGYFIPLEKEFLILFHNGPYGYYNQSTYNNEWEKNKGTYFLKNVRGQIYDAQKKVNGKFVLTTYFFSQQVLEQEFDTLVVIDGKFMAGKYKGNLLIYNKDLKRIDVPGIKACQQYGYGGWDYIQILQHNKLFYMDMNGNITSTKPISGGIPYGNDGGFPSTTYKIDKDNNGFVLHKEEVYPSYRRKGNKKTDYRITASNLYDSLLFLAPYERLLITKKDNLYGIAGYVIDENNKLLLLEEKVAPKYDAVEYVNRNHLKIRKNGLYNHFPTNDKPKYKKLEPFDESFARFELPDGRKGWLAIDGGEYIDED